MTIFVAGIHGAGKTFATRPACRKLGLVHATASELIKQERGLASWDASKMVSDVDQNQLALVAAAKRIRDEGAKLVLDGHLVLRRAAGDHKRLSVDIFRSLDCSAILLIRSPVAIVQERLRVRQDNSWSDEELAAFSKAEYEHGQNVAKALGISLTMLDAPSVDTVESWLVRLSNK